MSTDAPAPSAQRWNDGFADALRGFGLAGILAFLVIVAGVAVAMPLGALLIVFWAMWSRTPWRAIGYVRPKSWIATIAAGTLFGVAFKILMKAVVMPLLVADPVNHVYHRLAGDLPASLAVAAYVVVGGGWAEETVFRGYLFERLGKLLGSGVFAKSAIVILTTALFASLHYYDQGWPGVEQAVFTGTVFGTFFAATGRLVPVMVAHATFDLAALAMIYFGVESQFAHLVFR